MGTGNSPSFDSIGGWPAPRRFRCAWHAARRGVDGDHDRHAAGCSAASWQSLLDDYHAYLLDRFYSDLPIYAVIAGISFARLYAAEARRGIQEAHELALRTADLERRLVEARLQSLRAAAAAFPVQRAQHDQRLHRVRSAMARRLMAQLGDLLRASLRHTAQPLVTLGEELTFLDDFLAIESARFEGRLQVSRADDDLLPRMVRPSCCNRWSRMRSAMVSARDRPEAMSKLSSPAAAPGCRSACDDGVGLPPGWNFERDAAGLRNVGATRASMYGRPGLIRLEPRTSGGLDVEIDVPDRPVTGQANAGDAGGPMTRAGSATARADRGRRTAGARAAARLLTRDSRVEIAGCCAGGKRSMSCARRRGLARRCS